MGKSNAVGNRVLENQRDSRGGALLTMKLDSIGRRGDGVHIVGEVSGRAFLPLRGNLEELAPLSFGSVLK